MKKPISLFLIAAFLSLAMMSGCGQSSTITSFARPSLIAVTQMLPLTTPRLFPPSVIVVTSASNGSDPGTLRYALQTARAHDTIVFDLGIFRPNAHVPIYIEGELLPQINYDYLTLEASNGSVILDGSHLTGNWQSGLQIVNAVGVTIRGLQISNFTGPGIGISGDAHNNLIEGNRLTGNAEGINLSTPNTSQNTISGNFVGIGVDNVPAGNYNRGITIYEGAHDNTVGPGNVIAYNGPQDTIDYGLLGYDLYGPSDGCGIYVEKTEGQDSSGNKLTQNSIHDNKGNGICLVEDDHATYHNKGGANGNVRAAYILSVDTVTGFVGGISCFGCTVEVFSTQDGEEGQHYEGRTVAASNGVFKFQKKDPSGQNLNFEYDNITVTATDGDGNTSEFSRPAGIFNVAEWQRLQGNNDYTALLLLTKPSQLLPDNHIGAWLGGYTNYYDTDFVYRNGFKRIRIGQLSGSGQGWETIINSDTLSTDVTDTISEYHDDGVEIVLILASGAGLPAWGANFQNDEDIERYKTYIRFVVSAFPGRIHYYETWNEPVHITVEDYAHMVEEVVPVIRELDPNAKIIIGAMHGTWACCYRGYGDYMRNRLETDYLNQLLRSGIFDLAKVDGISWHPFYDNIPGDPYYQEYPYIVQSINELAESQGFEGEYFADEILWTTMGEEHAQNGPPVSQLIAAKYYTRAIVEHRGLDVNVTINPDPQKSFLAPIANLCNTLAGAVPVHIPIFLETNEDANVRSYAFTLPDGDWLVALWTNDEAIDETVEEAPGVPSALRIDSSQIMRFGFSPGRVIGIDVLHGFEQDLRFRMENGCLVIDHLMVKDYPIILRFMR